MQPKLTVSIVSHKNRDLLRECLESVYGEGGAGVDCEVIAVINAPGDGSAQMVRENFPSARVIENQEPMGFSQNHNMALRGAEGKFIAILNDDIRLHPGCLKTLVGFLESRADAGVVGPRTLNDDGSLQESCFRLPTLGVLFYDAFFLSSIFPGNITIGGYKRWAHDAVREVGHVVGACMVMPREVFESTGGLDESFFLYYEEADLCKRIRGAGKKIYFEPGAVITHHGGASIMRLGPEQAARFHGSLCKYYEKHFGRASLIGVYALNMAGAALRLAIFALASPFSRKARARAELKREQYRRILAWYAGTMFGGDKTAGRDSG